MSRQQTRIISPHLDEASDRLPVDVSMLVGDLARAIPKPEA